MRFYLILGLVNVCCFLPLYLLHIRLVPNPFHHLVIADKSHWSWPARAMYVRIPSPDPFRIHFDFTCVALLAVGTGATGPLARSIATAVLVLGFIEIQYTTVMHSIFKRPPALVSDWSLLRAGLSLAHRQRYWTAPALLGALALVFAGSWAATSMLFDAAPVTSWPSLVAASLLLPPLLYHVGRSHPFYLWRTVYSPLLHLVLNLSYSALLKQLYSHDERHYERHNRYTEVRLSASPNVVLVCVESYGSIVYRDAGSDAGVSELLRSYEPDLTRMGWRFASTFSEAPLFAGGSWLSYASLVYGARIDNVQLYDGLFARESAFGAYESLFHVLRRSGYANVLLCPLGGIATHTVDWDSLDRCLQPHWKIGFDDLGYVGPRVNFLGTVQLYSALDQYALNFGYERARSRTDRFSLFFCTLNSHYPWHSVAEASDDWRSLNVPAVAADIDRGRSRVDRYNAAIRYQLDYLLRFAKERTADAPLIILFGDHQPPMITPVEMGPQTPVHVLSQDPALIDGFLEHGFSSTLDLTGTEPRTIRHEGFLSLLMRGLQAAYGSERGLELPYFERGSDVLERADAAAGMPSRG